MHGEVKATPDGISYLPSPQFCGFEVFEYYVTDSSGLFTDTAKVTIEVVSAEDAIPSSSIDDMVETELNGDNTGGYDLLGVPSQFSADVTGDDLAVAPPEFYKNDTGGHLIIRM